MSVDRRGAVLLLVIVGLWAAMPAFACLPSTAQLACCRSMMHDCDSSMTMSGNSCCVVHSAPDAVLPGLAGTVDHLSDVAALPAALYPVPSLVLAPLVSSLTDSPPPIPSSGSSILRI